MPIRHIAETAEELVSQAWEEADREVVPYEYRERRKQRALEKLHEAEVIVPIRGAPSVKIREDALRLAERRRL